MAARVRVRDRGALAPPMLCCITWLHGTHVIFEGCPSLGGWHVCSSKEQVHRWGYSVSRAYFQAYASPTVATTPEAGRLYQSMARSAKYVGYMLQVSDADYLAAVLPISLVKAAVIGVASAPSI